MAEEITHWQDGVLVATTTVPDALDVLTTLLADLHTATSLAQVRTAATQAQTVLDSAT